METTYENYYVVTLIYMIIYTNKKILNRSILIVFKRLFVNFSLLVGIISLLSQYLKEIESYLHISFILRLQKKYQKLLKNKNS